MPSITTEKGDNRVPGVAFRAMEAKDDEIKPKRQTPEEQDKRKDSPKEALGDGGVQSYSGAGREGEGKDEGEFVRWSASTEIGYDI